MEVFLQNENFIAALIAPSFILCFSNLDLSDIITAHLQPIKTKCDDKGNELYSKLQSYT